MPRITRSTLRNNNLILEDEATVAAETPLPPTPVQERTPLGEVTGNLFQEIIYGQDFEAAGKPSKKAASTKGRKAKATKGSRKGRKNFDDLLQENEVEVLEDDDRSSTSSAVEEACKELMRESCGGPNQVPMHDQRPTTPLAKAVNIARKMLTPKPQTPRFDPTVHPSPVATPNPDREGRDSFLGAIESRTPLKTAETKSENDNLDKELVINAPSAPKEGSFSEHIVSRSPMRLIAQAEDPGAEFEAMENAPEKIVQAIPIMPDKPQSPVEALHVGNSPLLPHEVISISAVSEEPEALSARQPSVSRVSKTSSKKSVSVLHKKVPRRASLAKTPLVAQRRSSTRPEHSSTVRKSIKAGAKVSDSGVVAVAAPKPTVAAITPTQTKRHTTTKKPIPETAQTAVAKRDSPNITSAGEEQTKPESRKSRVSSLTTRPFIPTKSSKPPTRSTFALPGEAVAQKLKAAREERLKREEADKTQVPALKARPVRKSVVPSMEVKTNAASRARTSIAGRATSSGKGADEATKGPVIRPLARISSTGSNQANPNRHRVLKPQHEASTATPTTTPAKANTSATRTAPLAASKAPSKRISTISKATGKEVFARAKLEEEARLKEKKEKEEAAKKARAQAAERGRLASREWAEKMKARKAGAAGNGKVEVGSGTEADGDAVVDKESSGNGVGGDSVVEGAASSA